MADEGRNVAVGDSVSDGRVDEIGEEGYPVIESLARVSISRPSQDWPTRSQLNYQ